MLSPGTRLGPYVSIDGKSFLVADRAPVGPVQPITVVLNWPALLKR